jgi:hypothetical protein
MVNGKIKQILDESKDIKKIKVRYPQLITPGEGEVVDANFDTQTRSIIFFTITQYPKPRSDKFHLMRTFLFDLRGTHEILCKDIDTGSVYGVGNDYTVDGSTLILQLARQ